MRHGLLIGSIDTNVNLEDLDNCVLHLDCFSSTARINMRSLDFVSLGSDLHRLMSTMFRIHNSLRVLPNQIYAHFQKIRDTSDPTTMDSHHSRLYFIYSLRSSVLMLRIFIELYKKIKSVSAVQIDDDPAIQELFRFCGLITRLRLLVTHGDFYKSYGPFPRELQRINLCKLLHLATSMAKWTDASLEPYKAAYPDSNNLVISPILNNTVRANLEAIFKIVEPLRVQSRARESA